MRRASPAPMRPMRDHVTDPPAPIANDRSAASTASPAAGAASPGGADGAAGKAAFVRAMFARIVPRYDTINTYDDARAGPLMAPADRRIGRAQRRAPWRSTSRQVPENSPSRWLRQGARAVVGADFCFEMLEVAAKEKGAQMPKKRARKKKRTAGCIDSLRATRCGCRFRTTLSIVSSTASCCAMSAICPRPSPSSAACSSRAAGSPASTSLRRAARSTGSSAFDIGRMGPTVRRPGRGQLFAYRCLYRSLSPHPDATSSPGSFVPPGSAKPVTG